MKFINSRYFALTMGVFGVGAVLAPYPWGPIGSYVFATLSLVANIRDIRRSWRSHKKWKLKTQALDALIAKNQSLSDARVIDYDQKMFEAFPDAEQVVSGMAYKDGEIHYFCKEDPDLYGLQNIVSLPLVEFCERVYGPDDAQHEAVMLKLRYG